jgi:putative oxidoreductase
MDFLQDLLLLIGRICFSGMFIWGAFDRIMNWKGAMSYLKDRKIPFLDIALPASVTLQIIGSLLIFFGYHASLGALLLLLVMIPATYFIHPFWDFKGTERMHQKHQFMKSVALIGALIMILAVGGGHWGVTQ